MSLPIPRAALVACANRVAAESRRGGAPFLSLTSSPETIAAWLQWCDPNGCHTAENAIAEGFDPYTEETAWPALADMLRENLDEETRKETLP